MANTSTPETTYTSNRPTYSCGRCIDRKVKCDRQQPCSACQKHKVDCVFNTLHPPRKRQKRAKDQILEDRLQYYEKLLRKHGIDPERPVGTSEHIEQQIEVDRNGSVDETRVPIRSLTKTQIFDSQGNSQFVHNSLLTRVVEELQEDEPENHIVDDIETSNDGSRFILDDESEVASRSSHPPPEQIHQLWRIYTENVDPLTKVIHVPSLRPAIIKAVEDISNIPHTFEALIFAIYGAAVMSLDDQECQKKFQRSHHTLLSRYISNTKNALARVNFMATTSLVVLQALVLHILTVRDIIEPRAVWSLTGVAVRIAEQMGLDRDGSSFGLSVFESEMRRRIWWLLKTHDFRTAELCGLPKFRDLNTGLNNTKWPTNVNDDKLYPGCPPLVNKLEGLTDSAFLAMRHEIANFAANRVAEFRQQGKGPDQWDLHAPAITKEKIDEAFRGLEQLLETKYLRYCDPSQPLHLMVMLIARFSLNIIQFLGHHPRRWASIEQTPPEERQRVWEISMKLLEQHSMVQSNPQLKGFAWHAPYFQQWHAFIHVLDVLKSDPLVYNAEKAWDIIGTIYKNTPDMISDTRKPINLAVGNLCLKAYKERENSMKEGVVLAPEYILLLRKQREAMKNRSHPRETSKRQSMSCGIEIQEQISSADIPSLESTTISTDFDFGSAGLTSDLMEPSTDNDFWHLNGFEDPINDIGSGIDFDLNDMLDHDSGIANENFSDISWEQWDTWLADSNLMPSLPQI